MTEARVTVQEELELRVIASLVAEPDWIGEAMTELKPDDFSEEGCGELFAAACKLFEYGRPVNSLTVTLEAGDWAQGLVKALPALAEPVHATFAALCASLRARSRLRKVQALGLRLSGAEDLTFAGHLMDELNGAMAGRQSARVVSIQDALVDFMDRLQDKPVYLPWGMKRLDEELVAELGDFIILGGYSSSGKTLLAIQFALLMAQSYKVGFFSLETSDRKLLDRAVAHHARVSLKAIKRRKLAQRDYDMLASSAAELGKLDLTIIDAGGMTVSDIKAITLQHRFQIIFVDYLQIIREDGVKFTDLRQQVTRISVALKTMGRENGVAVVALAQLVRPERGKGKPTPPNVHSLRESSQLENDGDVVMLLYPEDPDDNGSRRILKVGKNKEGEKLKIELAFDGATQTMTPASGEKATMQKLADAGRKAKQEYRQAARKAGEFQEIEGEEGDIPF